ncbi:MAG: cyclase family protein [Gemmatimonadota bacterium]
MRHDITIAMGAGTPEWPGDTPFSCGWAWDMAAGASVNVGKVTTSLHVGTHADAPLHVRIDGAPSEALPLEAFCGPATVLDARDAGDGPTLTTEWLQTALEGQAVPTRVLLRTGRTVAEGTFPAAWPSLTPAAAAWLTRAGLRLLGVDAPSVDPRQATDLAVHHALFDGGAFLVENLQLEGVEVGAYHLTAYPLLVAGADAAPIRAVLEPLRP